MFFFGKLTEVLKFLRTFVSDAILEGKKEIAIKEIRFLVLKYP